MGMGMGGGGFGGGGGPGGPGGPGYGRHGYHRFDENDPAGKLELRISDARMLGWFYRNLAPYWPRIVIGVTAMLLGTAAGLRVPMILKRIMDDVIVRRDVTLLSGLALQFLGFTLLSLMFGAVRTTIMHLLGQRFVYSLRAECYRHLMGLGLSFFERQRSGDIMSRVSNDVGAVEDMVVHGTDDIISNSVYVVGAAGCLFWLNWKLAIVALAPVPIFVGSLWVFSHFIRPIFNQIRRELARSTPSSRSASAASASSRLSRAKSRRSVSSTRATAPTGG